MSRSENEKHFVYDYLNSERIMIAPDYSLANKPAPFKLALMDEKKLDDFIWKKDEEALSKYKPSQPWGIEATVDLKQCNSQAIRDANTVRRFTHELCDRICMKRYGETVVVDFGEDPRVSGFSMTQLIETSLVSAHFVNQTNAAYINIFSCKGFPPYSAGYFAMRFFKAKEANIDWKLRI